MAEIATVRELWEAGKTAGQIAVRLEGRSRNSVIGCANRNGMSSRPSPITQSAKAGEE